MITVTDTASKRIKQTLDRRGKGVGLRLGVKTTGCSGLAYVLEYVDCPTQDDQCFESQGCKLFVDPKSLAYIQGVEVDWVRNGLNEGFEFRNPNERDRCGCGESFRV
jgi:iron-sulfur cluster assembly protein